MTSSDVPVVISSGTKWILPDGMVIEWCRDKRIGDTLTGKCGLMYQTHQAGCDG